MFLCSLLLSLDLNVLLHLRLCVWLLRLLNAFNIVVVARVWCCAYVCYACGRLSFCCIDVCHLLVACIVYMGCFVFELRVVNSIVCYFV